YLGTHENNGWRTNVHARLGSRDVHDRLGRRRSLSESPPSSDSKDSRHKRHKREDEDMSHPWRRQKVDAFIRRISDFSEDKRRRMPANVKTYDGTGDPDDHLKIFESAATIENWPQPVWCHMFYSTLVGNARNWFSKLPHRSIDGFEELRRAFHMNFTQRKKCAKNPVELARVKQRQGESTSAYVERYKDEYIHVKASFIQGEATGADSKKSYSNYKSQEQPRRQSNDQSSNRNNSYRNQRDGWGNDKYTPLTKTPMEILATEGANFSKPPPMCTLEERRVGNGYYKYHGQKGHTTNECVQLHQLIDKLVKEGRLDHLVKNIKEGKDKQKIVGKKDTPKDKADTIYMVQSWQSPSPYNGIIGRPGISVIRAVPSTAHGMLKFPVDDGMVTIYNITVPPRECNTVACATYQRLVDSAFKGKVGHNLEVYVDDLVIKSHTKDELVRDIKETFRTLRKINMKLNPKKCTFGAIEGMFLGYLIESDGIKPCPEKTKAVIQLPSPRTMNEVQSLNGKLAGLNRFLSKCLGGCIQTRGKIAAIDADEDVTLVDVEKDEEVVTMDAEPQGRLTQKEVNAISKGVSAFGTPELVSAVELTLFDDEDKLHDEEVQKDAARDKQEKDDMERAQVLQKQYDDKEENIDWSVVADQVQERRLDNIKKYQNFKKKPVSIAQAKKNMIIYLKNMVGYKMKFFRGMTYDKVRPIFEREYKKV
nr:reverse transcriptase domain-containing protein [Tanacetum cinerariifolium]